MTFPEGCIARWSSRRGRLLGAVGLILLIAGGCSSDDGASEASAPQATGTPSESPAPTFDDVEDLVTYCRSGSEDDISDGYPDAAEYTGTGPHATAVFRRTPLNDAHSARHRLEDSSDYEDWLPESPEDTELLVCVGVGSRGSDSIDTCEYEESLSLVTHVGTGETEEYPLYEQTLEYTVYALRSGDVVESGEIPVGSGECPGSLISDATFQDISEVYTHADYGALDAAIEEVVTADAS
ncbi:hypothetical protein J4H86_08735 [Spiractinospora alimapuensis]|uniref:hypothetical protein n=1 Tax=Spiractinospora alimapuensis TaxID=2820884 RepID=UPI001F37CA45|nr:hypothetical protein [Spiractinospora alimapuensis]QVQ53780.1 hypothetical protein J4H86_08735 [Spiractinospora alimapuensis]